uniref:uncharacterized protein LOC122581871 n=1 Tax=Erigeron canadensis TaxID=72917 RepID=UPI001CB88BBF|nr:uncharacterized protein LOC122581871 [Erigeron canadensis]
MEQKQKSLATGKLPPFSEKCPWLVAENAKDQIFFTMHDPLSQYRCRISEFLGRRIRGFFHGWVILSKHPDHITWSLWNPVISEELIHLPPLRILTDGDIVEECCLSSPADDPSSVLLLTTKNRTFVFCRIDRKQKKMRWKKMTYTKQLKSITRNESSLHCITCCNGKVYALIKGVRRNDRLIIQVDIVVVDEEVEISLSRFAGIPQPTYNGQFSSMKFFLNGYGTELFYLILGFDKVAKNTLGAVHLFKFDMTRKISKEMAGLKDAIFFVDLAHEYVSYRPSIASEFGGHIHILSEMGKVIFSCNIVDKTISLSCMPFLEPTRHVSFWKLRLPGDHEEVNRRTGFERKDYREDVSEIEINSTSNEQLEENIASYIFNIPFDVLKKIVEFFGCVEYLNFRATCKYCLLAAPMIQWRRRLRTYSVDLPWLVVLDKHQGIFIFTDPMSGEKYFKKKPEKLTDELEICCSRYGWLLIKNNHLGEYLFFNPFTNDIRELPHTPSLDCVCFSEPPHSPDCLVVGFLGSNEWNVYIHFVNRGTVWAILHMNFGDTSPHSIYFPTFYGRDIYVLDEGVLHVFKEKEGVYEHNNAVVGAPRGSCSKSSAQYFQVSCNQDLLMVIVDEFGESVEVFKLNHSLNKWKKIDSLGKYMIYICGKICLCLEAKIPEMENKIYFSRLHSKNSKIVFYSLDTCRYHTFNGREIEQSFGDFFETKYYLYPQAWIEPSWS